MNDLSAAFSSDPPPNPAERVTSRLVQQATEIAVNTVDIAGYLDEIEAQSRDHQRTLATLRGGADRIVQATAAVGSAIGSVDSASRAAQQTVLRSAGDLRSATSRSATVAGWVQGIGARMTAVEQTLAGVRGMNTDIAEIASQVNILAINAKIEAARAGDAGRGFSVVAVAINDLSRRTADAAQRISDAILGLTEAIGTLRSEAEVVSRDAGAVLQDTERTDAALTAIADEVARTASAAADIAHQSDAASSAVVSFRPAFDSIAGAVTQTTERVKSARQRITRLVDTAEAIVLSGIEQGGVSSDSRFIDEVKRLATEVSRSFERGIASGRIRAEALFDMRYRPIAGTDPPQVMTPFTGFADEVLPPILEGALALDPAVVFCAAVDRNGYLPTHNARFSHPQGPDPVWNAANCRNRRIFDDRVGLKAGRNTHPFLMQLYRRAMGGGTYVMMKDISAPIVVNGRHWGGLRLAVKV